MTKRNYAHGNALVLEALGSDGSMYRGRFSIHRGQLTCEHFGASARNPATTTHDAIYRARELHWKGRPR